MNPTVKNILAVVIGIVVGMAVNMGIVMLGPYLVPYPEGMDPASSESIAEHIDEFTAGNFLIPILAHALGTLAGAVVTVLMAASRKFQMAMIVGVFFLLGGIANVFMIPGPAWFNAADLIVAYLPMSWLGFRLAGGRNEAIR